MNNFFKGLWRFIWFFISGNKNEVPIFIVFNGEKFKCEGEATWPDGWVNRPKPTIDPIKDSARDIIFDNPTGYISDNPLFNTSDHAERTRIRMAKAILELDAVAYCPPSAETQMMILKAKLILKDAENKSDGE